MSENSDAAELEAYGNIDFLDGLFEYLFLEGVGVLFTLIAFIIIIISSVKLIRGYDIPGARPIFVSIIFTLILAILSASYSFVLDIDENITFEAIIDIFLGLLFFVGSLGFLHLSRFAITAGASNTPQPTQKSDSAGL